MRTKNQAILEDFILPNYDKRKKEYAAIKSLCEINPSLLNVELLTEITLNKLVNAEFSDGIHTDAVSTCGKIKYEWKTASVHPSLRDACNNCYPIEITHCASQGGVSKQGHIGAVVHNKIKNRIDYLAIPQRDIDGLLNSCGTKNSLKKIRGTYNVQRDDYADKLNPYLCADVAELKQRLLALK